MLNFFTALPANTDCCFFSYENWIWWPRCTCTPLGKLKQIAKAIFCTIILLHLIMLLDQVWVLNLQNQFVNILEILAAYAVPVPLMDEPYFAVCQMASHQLSRCAGKWASSPLSSDTRTARFPGWGAASTWSDSITENQTAVSQRGFLSLAFGLES